MLRVVLVGICLVGAGTARAELTLCNPSEQPRSVAIAYSAEGVWTSEGWWSVEPGGCTEVLSGPLKQRNIYYTLSGEAGFAGDYAFCVTPQAFTLQEADGDCAALGAEERTFGHIDTGETAAAFRYDLPPFASLSTGSAEAAPTPAPAALPDAARTPTFAQGTLGEPFSVTALLQGCGQTEEFSGCTFYAEGWRWMAAEGAGSNPDALAAMAALPVNTPLFVTGDLIFYGDITVEAAVSNVELDSPDPYADLRATLQGAWVSMDDPASSFILNGSELTDLYQGEEMARMMITLSDACPDGEPIGPVIVQRIFGEEPDSAICLAIVEATAGQLTLSYVGRGNTLVYTRP
jgi:uncharacterized membrane protein